jgi:hypothetical protein
MIQFWRKSGSSGKSTPHALTITWTARARSILEDFMRTEQLHKEQGRQYVTLPPTRIEPRKPEGGDGKDAIIAA